jgi:hypothetical protein
MLSSNLLKITVVFAAIFVSSCSFWQSKTVATPASTTSVSEIKSAIPFSTKEPNVYQTEISIAANGVEDSTFTARNATNQLTVFDFRKKTEFALLKNGENQIFLINHRRKIYAENASTANVSEVKGDSLKDFLTAEWLNQKKDAKFETLSAENGFAKYRVNLDETTNSEIIVFVDEKIGLPVKQEFYTISGEQKTLSFTVELKNFSQQIEAKNFDLPKDYRKVMPKEFQDVLQRERTEQKND